MRAIDLRLNDHMQVIQTIPSNKKEMEEEFDFPNFPYLSYDIYFDSFIGKHVHWHWHNGFQFIQVLKGEIMIRTGSNAAKATPGDICFLNFNVGHCLEPISPPEDCAVRALLFFPDLICSSYETNLTSKYIQPIINRQEMDMVCISSQDAGIFRQYLDAADEANRNKDFGFEFEVRHHITRMWITFLEALRFNNLTIGQQDLRVRDRMRTMLRFIRVNYNRKIDLDEIAESAMISQRECFRCFQKTMGTTPTHYLQNFRVRQAARMLLDSDDTVSDISQAVGFSDTSYFGKTFQRYMNCSPTEYRKRHQLDSTPLDQHDY